MENKDPNIIKLRTVQELRRKVGKNTRKKLTRFEESREIVDSSLVVGALVIKRWIVERKELKKVRDALKLRRMALKREKELEAIASQRSMTTPLQTESDQAPAMFSPRHVGQWTDREN